MTLDVNGPHEAESRKTVKAQDGTAIFLRVWQQPEFARGTVIVVHGLCEHGNRHSHVARRLFGLGYNVLVPDMRGHGMSGGVATHVDQFAMYLDDIDCVRGSCGTADLPTILVGHSFGGLISARYAQTRAGEVDGLVMMSPLLRSQVPVGRCRMALGRFFSFVHPRARFKTHIDPADTSSDCAAIARRHADPLMHRSVTAGWYFCMLNALRDVWDDADDLTVPLLVCQGMADRIVDPLAPIAWLREVRGGDKSLVLLPDHRHELFHESSWPATVKCVQDWLEMRFAYHLALEPA